jgi:hypothetical protein
VPSLRAEQAQRQTSGTHERAGIALDVFCVDVGIGEKKQFADFSVTINRSPMQSGLQPNTTSNHENISDAHWELLQWHLSVFESTSALFDSNNLETSRWPLQAA